MCDTERRARAASRAEREGELNLRVDCKKVRRASTSPYPRTSSREDPHKEISSSTDSLDWDANLSAIHLTGQIIFEADRLTVRNESDPLLSVTDVLFPAPGEDLDSSDEDVFITPNDTPCGRRGSFPKDPGLAPLLRKKLKEKWSQESENSAAGHISDTETVVEPVGEQVATMATPETLKHREDVILCIDTATEDLVPMVFDENPLEFNKQKVIQGDELKQKLNKSVAFLKVNDTAYLNANFAQDVTRVKLDLSAFVRNAQKHIKHVQDQQGDAALVAAAQADEANAEHKRIRTERVTRLLVELERKTDDLLTAYSELEENPTPTDRDVDAETTQLNIFNKETEECLKDLNNLEKDALSAGMADQLTQLERLSSKLKRKKNDCTRDNMELRKDRGIDGRQGGSKSRLIDVKPPHFSGEISNGKLDFFSFKTEFNVYSKSKTLSLEDQVYVLINTCLEGPPKTLVKHLTDLAVIWRNLASAYGNPSFLLDAKIDEIKKLGPCKGDPEKRREWAIDAHAKLKRIYDIASEHKLVDELHHSDIVGNVRKLFPYDVVKDFMEIIRDIEADQGIEVKKPQLFMILLKFLDDLVSRETLNIRVSKMMGSENDSQKSGTSRPSKPPDPKHPMQTRSNTNKRGYQVSQNPLQQNFQNAQNQPPQFYQVSQNPPLYAPYAVPPMVMPPPPPSQGTYQQHSGPPRGNQNKKAKNNVKKYQNSGGQGGSNQNWKQAGQPTPPKGAFCKKCNLEHTHLFDCFNFQGKSIHDRSDLAAYLKVCHRCLRLDSQLSFTAKGKWWKTHEVNCQTSFPCTTGHCAAKDKCRQKHIIMCDTHSKENSTEINNFIASMDQSRVVPGLSFFFMSPNVCNVNSMDVDCNDDLALPAIYMVQTVSGQGNVPLLLFYDSGCTGASMSSRAYSVLDTTVVREGPTTLNVAGGKSFVIDYGEERFTLPLSNSDDRATLVALRMDEVTNAFPCWELQQAYDEVSQDYYKQVPHGPPLPAVDEKVGGTKVDLMVGIRFNQFFPTLDHMLPGGLAIYTAKIQSASGNQGVLGGCHKSWRNATNKAFYMTPRAYFTSELRAYCAQNEALSFRDALDYVNAKDDIFDSSGQPETCYGSEEKTSQRRFSETLPCVDVATETSIYNPNPADGADACTRHPDGKTFIQELDTTTTSFRSSVDTTTGFSDSEKDAPGKFLEGKTFIQKLDSTTTTFRSSVDTTTGFSGSEKDAPGKFLESNDLQTEMKYFSSFFIGDDSLDSTCKQHHCERHKTEMWVSPPEWEGTCSMYTVLQDERRFLAVENTGTEADYRCVACRNCAKCRDSELNEKVSLHQEVEQALLEKSLSYDPVNKVVVATLPFTEDPATALKPNRHIAERVFASQEKMVRKHPEMRADIIKSHDKLRDKGFVIALSDLSEEDSAAFHIIPGDGYYIPWQIVYKETSLSTPIRMVFNASSVTGTGKSLNSILAKGDNNLAKIFDIMIRFRSGKVGMTGDVKMAYNGIKLRRDYWKYQMYLWKEGLDPLGPVIVMIIVTLIYGIKSSGQQMIAAFALLALICSEEHPEHYDGAEALRRSTYMDDLIHAVRDMTEARRVAESITFTLDMGSMAVKCYTYSGESPSELVSSDGVHVGVLGNRWDSKRDELKLDVKDLYFGKPKRGKLPAPVAGDLKEALKGSFTRRHMVGKVAGVFDQIGLLTPITAKLKLDLHLLTDLKLDWDDPIPVGLLDSWVENLETIQKVNDIIFPRAVVSKNAKSDQFELLVSCDASQDIAIASVHARSELKDGNFHCQLLAAKSKLVKGVSIPRAELKAALLGAVLSQVIKKNILEYFERVTFVTDSTITLFWINQDYRPLQVAVRNAVIQIRRFSLPEQWFHVDTHNNIADLGTRPATLDEVGPGSDWQQGRPWMRLPRDQWRLKSVNELQLDAKQKRDAAKEMKSPDVGGHMVNDLVTHVGQRYSFSKYLFDPCARPWPVALKVMCVLYRIRDRIKNKTPMVKTRVYQEEEMDRARKYFFQKGTLEVKHFAKQKDFKDISTLKDKILYYNGRVLDSTELDAMENVMIDLTPMSFVKPMLDRFSPVAYSLMVHCHSKLTHHRSTVATLRESYNHAYVISGRDLAAEVRESCTLCKRYRRQLLEVEQAGVHKSRLTIAPAFYNAQCDLLGPFTAWSEHNHRSTIKVWGVVFKCPTTAAISVHAMSSCTTSSFIRAYTVFSSHRGHPNKLYIDEGGQLIKGCKEMEINILDIESDLDTKFQVGIEYETCPVGAHNSHGVVERSIREIRRFFMTMFNGLKLDSLGYESAFAWISNEMNNLPICLGSRYKDLSHLDLISPNRLLLGRNNRRSPVGCTLAPIPDKLMKQMKSVYDAWWNTWKEEKLVEYVPQPKKWTKTTYVPQAGDVVLFPREEKRALLGQTAWRIGRVQSTEPGSDRKTRVAIIEYRNYKEKVYRSTRRSVRDLAVLHKEGTLELIDTLNKASKEANISFLMKEPSLHYLA